MDKELYEYLLELLEEEIGRAESEPFCGTSEWAAEAFEGAVASQVADAKQAIEKLRGLKNDFNKEDK